MNIDLQITAAKRELALRRRVYPRWVTIRKMNEESAQHEINAMSAILFTLRELRASPECDRIINDAEVSERNSEGGNEPHGLPGF